jgi:hypothetical protein
MKVPFKPKVLKRVTIPFQKIEQNKPYYFRLESELYEGTSNDTTKKAPTLLRVFNFERQEVMQVIAGAVLVRALTESYPNGGYVGKCFEVVMHKAAKPSAKGQPLNLYNLTEIAEPSPEDFTPTNESAPVSESAPAAMVAAENKTRDASRKVSRSAKK